MLDIRPGITDLSSIVFSDEGDILDGKPDPDLTYNQVIRPWKSRLSLLYVRHANVLLDIRLVFLTLIAIFSRRHALGAISHIVQSLGGGGELAKVAARLEPLCAVPPPGATQIVQDRNRVPM